MKIRRTLVALTAAGALGVGALSIPASAQDDDAPTAQQDAPASRLETRQESREGLRDQIRDRARELLAAELGVAEEELEAAHAATREQLREEFGDELEARRDEHRARMLEHVDRALDNGRITEDEADALRGRIEDGEPPVGGFGHRLHRGPGLGVPGGAAAD